MAVLYDIKMVDSHQFAVGGFTVDELIAYHQVVIKGMSKLYEGVKGLSGATILGDGTVALILDAPILVESVMNNGESVHQLTIDFKI